MAKLAKPVGEKKPVEKINEEAVVSSSSGFISGEDETVTSLKGKGRGRKGKKGVIAEVKLEPAINDEKSPGKKSGTERGRNKEQNEVEENYQNEPEAPPVDVLTAAPLEKKPVAKGRGKDKDVVVAEVESVTQTEKKSTTKGRVKKVEHEVAETDTVSAEVVTSIPVDKKSAAKGRSKKTATELQYDEIATAEVITKSPVEKKAKGRGKKAETAVTELEASSAEAIPPMHLEKKPIAKGRSKKVATHVEVEKKPAAKGRGKKAEAALGGTEAPSTEVITLQQAGKKPAGMGRGKKPETVVNVKSDPETNESINAENGIPTLSPKPRSKTALAATMEEGNVEKGATVITAAPAAKGRGRGKKNTAAPTMPVEENTVALPAGEEVVKQRGKKKIIKTIAIKEENQNGENVVETVMESKKRAAKLAANGKSEETDLCVKSTEAMANVVKQEPEDKIVGTLFDKSTEKSSKAKAGSKRKICNEEAVEPVKPKDVEIKVENMEGVEKPSPKKKAKKEAKAKKPKEVKSNAKAAETTETGTASHLEKPKETKLRSKKEKTPGKDTPNQLENGVVQQEKKPQGRKRAAAATDETVEKDEADGAKRVQQEKKPQGRKRAAAATDETVEKDEADGAKPAKAKKTGGKLMNSTATKYDKEDFKLHPGDNGEERYNLKISSWNVAGLRSWLNKDGLRYLEYELPDIFCLQEIKCTTEQMPDEVARIPGYHPYWLCMPGGYAGVAIYSKIMPINVEYGIGNKEFDAVGRMITAEYEKFFLINVYVPNSGRKLVNLEARMRWEKLFQEYVKRLDAVKAVVICGDMNVSHQAIDLANPKTNTRSAGFTKEERDKMTELLGLGFVDTFRHLYPDRTAAYTYWTYMANARSRNVGWRLDYFIVSERFIKRVVDNCIRSQVMGSDHCPITLFLNI